MRSLLFALGIAGLAISSAASAQQENLTGLTKRTGIAKQLLVKPTPKVSRCMVSGYGYDDVVAKTVSPDNCANNANAAYLLESFYLAYLDGSDHKTKTIKLIPPPNVWRAGIGDNDGNDRTRAEASYAVVPGVREFAATMGRCRKTCILPLEPKRDDEIFVLRGFSFKHILSDVHVERVAINPLQGDQLEVIADDLLANIEIHYAYIPRAMAKRQYTATGSNYWEHHQSFAKPGRDEIDVISGFSFWFKNGGHYLSEIGMKSAGSNWNPTMKDKNKDDLMEWRFQLVRIGT